MKADILLKPIMYLITHMKNENAELQFHAALMAIEQLPSEAQKKHARALLLSVWVGVSVSASEAKYLLSQDDLYSVLSERKLAKRYIRFDAYTRQYQWTKTVRADSWLYRNLPTFTSRPFATLIQQSIAFPLMLAFVLGVVGFLMGTFSIGLHYWIGDLILRRDLAIAVVMLAPLLATAAGAMLPGLALSNRIVANAAGSRLIELSSSRKNNARIQFA